MNLNGLRILNTRPFEQSASLHQSICDAGGQSIDFPALAIEPTVGDWLKNLPNLSTVQHAIFISTNTVNYFYRALEQQQLKWPTHIQTYAIGTSTAKALEQWNVRVDHIPSIADSEHLLQLDSLQQIKNQSIILVKGEGGRMDITNTLLKRGANLISFDVYRRVLPNTNQQQVHSLWHDEAVDIILFTSQQAIHNIFTLFGENARAWLCKIPCIVISERLAEAASRLGMQTVIVSHFDRILNALEHYKKGLTHDDQQ